MRELLSIRHPAVALLFFLLAIVCTVVLSHPAYLAVSLGGGALYYLVLRRARACKTLLCLLPVLVGIALLNGVLNTLGDTVLFVYFGRAYTWEALCYGCTTAAMFGAVLLWFLCYSAVMTSDKFTALFAPLLPSLSLLLVMVLRLVPAFVRKARQIGGARHGVGRQPSGSLRQRLQGAAAVLSALTGWALEGSVITADSMRARGYGTARRSSFPLYRFTAADGVLTAVMVCAAAVFCVAAAQGCTHAALIPAIDVAPVRGLLATAGLAAYALLLLLPTLFKLKEAIIWHFLRSGI